MITRHRRRDGLLSIIDTDEACRRCIGSKAVPADIPMPRFPYDARSVSGNRHTGLDGIGAWAGRSTQPS
jgi:hypothetical protein